MAQTVSTILPGDLVLASHPHLKLGPGLVQIQTSNGESSVVATRAGKLQKSANGKNWWIESNAKRYVPIAQENVIGTIVGRAGVDGWRVDIGGAHQANLDGLAFEGATKRNKPNLKINTLIYARVSLAHKDMEPELECFDAQTRKGDDYGELKGGFVVKCSLGLCRSLLQPKFYLLPLLGAKFPLEAIVGVNGRVWFRTGEVRHTIAVSRCLEAADPTNGAMSEEQVRKLIASIDI